MARPKPKPDVDEVLRLRLGEHKYKLMLQRLKLAIAAVDTIAGVAPDLAELRPMLAGDAKRSLDSFLSALNGFAASTSPDKLPVRVNRQLRVVDLSGSYPKKATPNG